MNTPATRRIFIWVCGEAGRGLARRGPARRGVALRQMTQKIILDSEVRWY